MINFLKKIFSIDGRLDRVGYLLLGILPIGGVIFALDKSYAYRMNFTIFLTLFGLLTILSFVSVVKRGRDSGLSGLMTLFLFVAVPLVVVVLSTIVQIDISYGAFLFIGYLLFVPSSSKELKEFGKSEYFLTTIFMGLSSILFILLLFAPTVHTCGETPKVKLSCTAMQSNSWALKMFRLDNEVYPTTKEGIEALLSNPDTLKYPNYPTEPYLERFPKDPWGSKIVYLKTKDGFNLISYGADRKEGGEDENADIVFPDCLER